MIVFKFDYDKMFRIKNRSSSFVSEAIIKYVKMFFVCCADLCNLRHLGMDSIHVFFAVFGESFAAPTRNQTISLLFFARALESGREIYLRAL